MTGAGGRRGLCKVEDARDNQIGRRLYPGPPRPATFTKAVSILKIVLVRRESAFDGLVAVVCFVDFRPASQRSRLVVFIPVTLQTRLREVCSFRYRESHAITGFPSDTTVATAASIDRDRRSRSERELVTSRRSFSQTGDGTVKPKRRSTPQDVASLYERSTVLIVRRRLAE